MFTHQAIDMRAIPPLRCDIFTNVTLLPMVGDVMGPTYVYALDAYAQKKPLVQARRITNNDSSYLQLPYIKPWKYTDQEVLYGGIFHMHWGHFLLEVLQRLWYTKHCSLPIVWSGVWGVFHTPSQFKTWQKDIFTALGITNEHIFLTEPTQFAKVHFPEPGSGINTHLHPEQVAFLEYYEGTPVPGKYVYFSRAKIRSCANEEQIEQILKKHGWRIVYPETMSVAQQLKTISTAQVCLMIGGSAQHTMLLAKNLQTRFIVIPREHGNTYNFIAHAKSDNYYIFNLEKKVLYADGFDEANDFFTLDTDTLEDILQKTKNFTEHISHYAHILKKPDALIETNLKVPHSYYEPLAPITTARKLFYHAYFLYQQKKYRTAHKIFIHLEKNALLDDSMYIDYFNALQRYHISISASITAPLEKYHKQVHILRKKIIQKPQDTRNYKKLTELYLIAGNFHAALQLQEQLMQRNPKWSKPLAQIAYIFHAQQNVDKAIKYAQKAVEIEPHKLQRKIELVRYLLHNAAYDTCKHILSTALKDNPHWDEGYAELAAVHAAQNHLEKAIACAQKAVTLAPNNVTAQEQLAEYMRQKGDHTTAIDLWAKALQQNPRLAERYAQNARIFELKGDILKAIEYAAKAVEAEPRNFVCKTYLANYLRKHGDFEAAITLMTQAMHMNPFWSEPHAQFASIHEAQGNIDKAIECARMAVAVEPFNNTRKIQLKNYRMQKLSMLTQQQKPQIHFTKRHTSTHARIQSYIDTFFAQTYLEIGVAEGNTFLNMDVPFKVGVDPAFLFDVQKYAHEHAHFYQETSDAFFTKFPQRIKNMHHNYRQSHFLFDVIFIDGLHTFEQTLRDFANSLTYSHEKTIWIFDDTVPSQHFSAMNCQKTHDAWKACAGLSTDIAWHGDVFKAIFALHDNYPEFSYCTQVTNGNPQTIVWRTQKPTIRKKLFNKEKNLAHMRYEDFVAHAWVMHPVCDTEVLHKIFTNIDPLEHKTGEEYKHVIHPIVSDKEKEYAQKNKELQLQIQLLTKNNHAAKEEIAQLKQEVIRISKRIATVQKENTLLKTHKQNT